MIEKQSINGKDVWIEIEAHPAERANPNIIPTEYFTARYHLDEPGSGNGRFIVEDNDEPKLFESPVAALRYANDRLMKLV